MKTLANINPKQGEFYSALMKDRNGKITEGDVFVVIADDLKAILPIGIPIELQDLFNPQKITKEEARNSFHRRKSTTRSTRPKNDEELLLKNMTLLFADKFYEKYLAES